LITTLVTAALLAGPSQPAEPTAKHPIVVGDERISRGWLRHWADISARGSGGSRDVHRAEAARYLIAGHWIRGEAADQGIAAPRDEVTRELRQLRRQSFRTVRAYRRWLRESGRTPFDQRYQTKTFLLSDKLRAKATAGAATAEEQQEALSAFVAYFDAKWRPLTACRRPWVSRDCGAVKSPGRTRRSPSQGRRTSSWDGGDGSGLPSGSSFRRIAPAS
jgi:hypothetical protein